MATRYKPLDTVNDGTLSDWQCPTLILKTDCCFSWGQGRSQGGGQGCMLLRLDCPEWLSLCVRWYLCWWYPYSTCHHCASFLPSIRLPSQHLLSVSPSALPSVSPVGLSALCVEPSVLLMGLHLPSHFVFLAKWFCLSQANVLSPWPTCVWRIECIRGNLSAQWSEKLGVVGTLYMGQGTGLRDLNC